MSRGVVKTRNFFLASLSPVHFFARRNIPPAAEFSGAQCVKSPDISRDTMLYALYAILSQKVQASALTLEKKYPLRRKDLFKKQNGTEKVEGEGFLGAFLIVSHDCRLLGPGGFVKVDNEGIALGSEL